MTIGHHRILIEERVDTDIFVEQFGPALAAKEQFDPAARSFSINNKKLNE